MSGQNLHNNGTLLFFYALSIFCMKKALGELESVGKNLRRGETFIYNVETAWR
jgi:hypothetical protein